MRRSRGFRQVDVFGEGAYLGNPVAVVLDGAEISFEEMQRFSAWTNLSECTFVLPPIAPGADYRVRILGLTTELPFAGHPTLGTARAWLDAGGRPAMQDVVIQECAAGLVPVRIGGELLSFSAPARTRSGPVDPQLVATLIEIVGVDPQAVVDAEWLDNGPGWVGLLLDDVATLRALRPDASAHPGRWDIGLIAPISSAAVAETGAASFELRAFFTDGSEPLREDPVTGSLNASAAEWLIASRRASAPYVAVQGSALGRRGRIHISQSDGRVWVGGRAQVAISGTVDL